MKTFLLPLPLALLLIMRGASTPANAQLEPLPGEGAETDGWKFRSEVDEGKVPASEVIAKLREMLPRLTNEAASDDTLFFDDFFAGACAVADAGELQELSKIALAVPAENFRIDSLLYALTGATFKQDVRRLEANLRIVAIAPCRAPLPACLEGASQALEEAWRMAQGTRAAWSAAMKAESSAQSPPDGDIEFSQRVLSRWMVERQPDAWRDLAKCEWRASCGTGSDMLYQPRNRGILLSMLADGRMPEAVGASFMLMSGGMSGTGKISTSREGARMITALGLDWETLYAGSLLPQPDEDFSRSQEGIASIYDWREHRSWSSLAAFGSERGVRLGLEIVRLAGLNARDTMEFLGTALGPEPVEPGVTRFSNGTEDLEREKPIQPEVRREVLAMASHYLQPTRPLMELVDALRLIPGHTVPDLRTPLLVLAGHRSPAVSSAARKLLKQAGLAENLPAPAVSFAPLRLRLMDCGEPIVNTKVRIGFEPRQHTASDAKTDAAGELSIPLDKALDPAAIRFIEIRGEPEGGMGIGIPGLEPLPGFEDETGSTDPRNMSAPWFVVKLPISAQQSGVREV
ncbi:MAG: hypothetical protein ABI680_07460, partial [Chthoniobacteraceae bacterium]